ncbi:hypothetical protein BN59_03747 [Legionella massiliensis]|uniref:Uncharacterized protein n=1 Tax=Legionella massiliensis TaxID=1034943 RepID=A0A078L5V1_9GAMM|nr:hypothetical protein BN59_03747 [Legionella massiliensis]CEE15167.1 hypothetical protein BN1094_03747 [Legionella massiliensis]
MLTILNFNKSHNKGTIRIGDVELINRDLAYYIVYKLYNRVVLNHTRLPQPQYQFQSSHLGDASGQGCELPPARSTFFALRSSFPN